MKTQISTKLAALGMALMMNLAMIGGIGYLFSSQLHQHPAATTLAAA